MTREDIIRMAQSVMQERGGSRMDDEEDLIAYSLQLAALVAAAEFAKREWNFCERCGKRAADLTTIHTCTPPRDGA